MRCLGSVRRAVESFFFFFPLWNVTPLSPLLLSCWWFGWAVLFSFVPSFVPPSLPSFLLSFSVTRCCRRWIQKNAIGVVACSALKKMYRDILSADLADRIIFLHLQVVFCCISTFTNAFRKKEGGGRDQASETEAHTCTHAHAHAHTTHECTPLFPLTRGGICF